MAESRDRQHPTRLSDRRASTGRGAGRSSRNMYQVRQCAPHDTRTTGAAATVSLLATPACGPSSFTCLRAAGAEWRDAARRGANPRRRASNLATRFLTPFGGYVRAPLVDLHVRGARMTTKTMLPSPSCARRPRPKVRRAGVILARMHGQRVGGCRYTPGCLTESSQTTDDDSVYMYISGDSSCSRGR